MVAKKKETAAKPEVKEEKKIAKKAPTKKTAAKKDVKTTVKTVVKKTVSKDEGKKTKVDTTVETVVETKISRGTKKSLNDLKDVVKEAEAPKAEEAKKEAKAETKTAEPRQPKKDKFGRSQAVGKKKDAIARVYLKLGKGKITVNDRDLKDYFPRPVLQMIINQPFAVTAREGQYDVICTAIGGGLSGQAYALRHGISRALDLFEPELHTALKKAGFLTRDSRIVERKKPGLSKARKRFQFSKR